MADLITAFLKIAEERADAPALIDRDETTSYATLNAKARGFAATCRARGLQPGDRVVLAMPVGADLFAALAGAWGAGLTVVFPEPAMGLSGLRHAVSVTQPKALIASGFYRFLALITRGLWGKPILSPGHRDQAPLVPPDPDSIALISFTSGSTGAPKAIPRSHGFLMAQNAAVSPLLEGDAADLVAFPVFTLVNLAAGRVSILPDWKLSRPDRVRPETLAALIARSGATRALLPPALCETLAKAGRTGLQTVFTGGGPVKPVLVKSLQDNGLRVISVYGSTEAEPIAEMDWANIRKADIDAMANGAGLLAGPPVPGIRLRIQDHEIQVAGPHVNTGYLDPSQDLDTKIHEDGVIWHRTGDAGRMDEMGRLWLLGRSNAIRKAGDRLLFPFAVELAAESWPGVARAALAERGAAAVLAIEGHAAHADEWAKRAPELGVAEVVPVPAVPLDRRHRSKVDYTALARHLE